MAASREPDPVELAVRALRARDRTTAELAARLERRGVGEPEREQALEVLERLGYVDDERLARARANELAARGSGDALIRHDLEGRGVSPELVEAAVRDLEPEHERARRVVEVRGATVRTARYLASRGFGEEVLEGIVAHDA